MRAWKLVVAIVIAMIYLPLAMAQQTPEGKWTTVDEKTGEKRAVIDFVLKDGTLFGTVNAVYPHQGDTKICSKCPGEFKDKPILGMQIAWGLKENGKGTWEGGKILDAESGKIYHVKMTVKGDKLYVRGYVGISMLGRTQVWLRS